MRILETMSHLFLPSLAEIGKAEVTKLVHGIHDEKVVEKVGPFLWHPSKDLAENFNVYSFFTAHPSAKFRLNTSSFLREYMQKVFFRSLHYRRETGTFITDGDCEAVLCLVDSVTETQLNR